MLCPLLSGYAPPSLQVITVPAGSPEVTLSAVEGEVGTVLQQQQQAAMAQAAAQQSSGRMVVAKPLLPSQSLPTSIKTNLVSIAAPTPAAGEPEVLFPVPPDVL